MSTATPTPAPRLSIVYLNYNRVADTQQTTEQLRALTAERDDIEVIAVDNGSSDGTLAYLQTQQTWLHLIETGYNAGIAGYNQGFAQARGDYLLVLDDDSCPADSATLDRLITQLDQQPTLGVVACRIEDGQGKPALTWHLPLTDTAGPSMAFIGCGFAIRRDLFAAIGWYPEAFFLYQNEIEVAIQVRRQGYEIHYDPSCRVIHRGTPADRPNWRRIYYPTRNTIWLIRRYFPRPAAFYLIASRLCIGLVRALQCHELTWYYRAVREAFKEPVPAEILPKRLRHELDAFWRQNSLWHQLTGHR